MAKRIATLLARDTFADAAMNKHCREGLRRARRLCRRCKSKSLVAIGCVPSYLYAWHADRHFKPKPQDDGHDHFVFLAGLVVTYGVALTIVTQGKDVSWGAMIVFLLISGLTIYGIARLLQQTSDEGKEPTRAFSVGTIAFGKWAMTFSLCVSLGFFFTAMAGALPGQGGPQDYMLDTVQTNVYHWHKSPLQTVYPSKGQSVEKRRLYDRQELFRAMGKSMDATAKKKVLPAPAADEGKPAVPLSTEKVFYVEQQRPFDSDYNSFALRIDVNEQFEVVSGHALLVSSNPEWSSTRTVNLPTTDDDEKKLCGVFMLEKPKRGELLRMIVVLRTRDQNTAFSETLRSEDAQLVLRKEGL